MQDLFFGAGGGGGWVLAGGGWWNSRLTGLNNKAVEILKRFRVQGLGLGGLGFREFRV